MKRFKLALFVILAIFFQVSPAWSAVYTVDKDHSSVTFKIKHLFSNVQGHFKDFQGTIEYDPEKPASWDTEGTIQVASIDTGVEQRDKHLKGADFFDVEKFPTISFEAKKVIADSKEKARIEGVIVMHGVEKPVILNVEIHGVGQDPWGNTRAGFTATTTLNRQDFGIVWNQALSTGGVLLGNEVLVTLEIEGILEKGEGK